MPGGIHARCHEHPVGFSKSRFSPEVRKLSQKHIGTKYLSGIGLTTWKRDRFVSVDAPAADGTLGVSGYADYREGQKRIDHNYFLRSRDDGLTWAEHANIGPGHNETDILRPDGKRLLAAARTVHEAREDLFVSENLGRSWTLQGPLTGPMEHPAHLLKPADGRVVLTYGIRRRGFYGIGARLSEDGGRNWLSPAVLVNLGDAWDGGYPSSVQLKDGSILTAYYAGGVKAHTRYHMGVVIWNVDEQWKLNRAPW